MATAKVRYTWADGDVLECEIRVAESFPDAVAEAKAQAQAMFAVALGITAAADEAAEQAGE